jgi:hypothetical protein
VLVLSALLVKQQAVMSMAQVRSPLQAMDF